MTNPLSPAANAVWEAFNQDEAGVFVDYGDKLAAALRAAAEYLSYGHGSWKGPSAIINEDELLAIAAELEACQ